MSNPKLRELADPYHPEYLWRMNGVVLEWTHTAFLTEWFQKSRFDAQEGSICEPRTWRVALWRDLFINPCVTDA